MFQLKHKNYQNKIIGQNELKNKMNTKFYNTWYIMPHHE